MRSTTRRVLTASVGALALATLAACGDPGSSGGGGSGSGSDGASSDLEACPGVAGDTLVALEDDQGLQLAENIVPAVNADAAEPALLAALDAVSDELEQDDLIVLNRAVDVDRENPAAAAQAWFDEAGIDIQDTSGSGSITIGAANFSESITLAELYGVALTAAGYDVSTQDGQNREVYLQTLTSGDIQVVPEYLATLTGFLNTQENGTDAESPATGDAAETYDALTPLAQDAGLTMGAYAEAGNANAFAVTAAFADEHDVESLSDLAEVCGDLVLGGPPECPERPFCQPGLEETYNLQISDFQSLDAGGPLTKGALQDGSLSLGLVFTSDPDLTD